MARRSRRDAPDPEDYIPDEKDDFEEDEEPRRRRRRPRDDDDDDDDEEEEERPRRRRSRRDEEDDEEEEPRRRRRRPRDDDDDDDDDEPPRRRRKRRDEEEDDEEEERPRRRRRPRDDDDDDEEPRRRKRRSRDDDDDDDEEDDEPRAKKSRKRKANRVAGWGGYDHVKSSTSSYADRLAVGKIKGEVLVKFMDEEPFAAFGLHWFDNLEGKKGWMCLISIGDEKCPGCAIGDRANPNALFNVLVLDDDGDWNMKVLQAGSRMSGQIKGLSEGKGGLTSHYWSVSAGPKGSGTGNFQKVKERDLEEDWDVEPLSDRELDEWEEEAHVLEDVEQIPSYKDFKEAVRDLED